MQIWFAGASISFNQIQFNSVSFIENLAQQSIDNCLPSIWHSPKGILARVLIFDQFPRCIFRGTSQAFKYDHLAILLVLDSIKTGLLLSSEYVTVHRFFMCVALQHSESMEHQVLGVELAAKITHGISISSQIFFPY